MSYEFYIYRDEDMFEKLYLSINHDLISYVKNKEDACLFRFGVLDKKNVKNENYIYYKTKKGLKEYFIIIENDSLELYDLNNSMLEAKSNTQNEILSLTTQEYTVKQLPNLENSSVLFEAKDNLYPPVRFYVGMYKIQLSENFYYFFEDNTDNDGLNPDIVQLSLDKIFDLHNDLYRIGQFDYNNENYTIFRTKAKVNFQDYYKLDIATPIVGLYGFGDPYSIRYLEEKLKAKEQVKGIYNAIEENNKMEEVRFVFNQTKFDAGSEMLKKSISYFYYPINESQPKLVEYDYDDFIGYYAMSVLTSSLPEPPVEPPVNNEDDFITPPEDTNNTEPNNEPDRPINDEDNFYADDTNVDNFEEEPLFPQENDIFEEDPNVPQEEPLFPQENDNFEEEPLFPQENDNEVYYEEDENYDPNYEGVIPLGNICFVKDTIIQTDAGLKKIQDITTKDTIDNIHVIGITKTINNNINHLIRIKKNAFRKNVPSKDIVVSRSHTIIINGTRKKAHELLNMNNSKIGKLSYNGEVLYNILLETYRFIKIENIYMETLHPNNKIAKLHKDVLWNNNIEHHIKENMVREANKLSEDCSILNRTYNNVNHEVLRK